MTVPLRDLFQDRADRSGQLDVHGVLASVRDLADRRASRRKTAYAATGASVGVAAVVAGSLALASGSSAPHRAPAPVGGGPVSPVPVPRSTRVLPLPRLSAPPVTPGSMPPSAVPCVAMPGASASFPLTPGATVAPCPTEPPTVGTPSSLPPLATPSVSSAPVRASSVPAHPASLPSTPPSAPAYSSTLSISVAPRPTTSH